MTRKYKLSCELGKHAGDVRDMAVAIDGSIVTVSGDKTATLWKFQNGQFNGDCVVMTGHSSFVSSVCIINPTNQYVNGLIVTAGGDNCICVYNFGDVEPVQKFLAHDSIVCSLKSSIADGNSFFSSSWDKTAKLWNFNNLTHPEKTYTGHATAVWCVAELPVDLVITGSTTGIVTVFRRGGNVLHTLRGHTDCVRDIAVVKKNEFLTCANDAAIKHWCAFTGKCLRKYHGHSNYIYSISSISEGHLMVSSGEDKTVRLWKDGKLDQTINFPAQSIWCVKYLSNEDIVCGASDGLVRIFTASPKRYANEETMQKFNEASINSKKSIEMKLSPKDIEGPAALFNPAESDGKTIFVFTGLGLQAYSWSKRQSKWIFKEDITDANLINNTKTETEIQYDHYFPIYLENSISPIIIPYNNGEDPWMAVQKFLDDNLLPQTFLNMFAHVIIRKLSRPAENNNSCKCIPLKNYLKLEQGSLDTIIGALKIINAKMGSQSLQEQQIELVAKLATDAHEDAITSGAIGYVMSLLNWPDEFVFPVLHILSLAVLKEKANEQLCTDALFSLIKAHLQKQSKNFKMTFRLLVNMFHNKKGESLALRYKDDVLNVIFALNSPVDQCYQLAVSTYLSNLAVALSKMSDSAAAKRLFDATSHLLKIFEESKAIYRLITVVGTLLTVYRELNTDAKALTNLLNDLKFLKPDNDLINVKIAEASTTVVDLIY